MSIIDDMYWGRLDVFEDVTEDKAHGEAVEKLYEAREKLEAQAGCAAAHEFETALGQVHEILLCQSFAIGFRTASKLFAETFFNK